MLIILLVEYSITNSYGKYLYKKTSSFIKDHNSLVLYCQSCSPRGIYYNRIYGLYHIVTMRCCVLNYSIFLIFSNLFKIRFIDIYNQDIVYSIFHDIIVHRHVVSLSCYRNTMRRNIFPPPKQTES